jgi:CRISPR-associated protein Csd1
MLKQLADYAHTHELVTEAGFEPKAVRWAIALDSKVGFIGLAELGQADLKRNPGRTFKKCPDLSQMELVSGSETKSHFLVETADVVALYAGKAEDVKTRAKHRYFIHLLEEAGKTMPQLDKIGNFLKEDPTFQAIQKAMVEGNVRANDKVTFQIDGEFSVEQDYWHDWWRKYRQNLKGGPEKQTDSNLMRCYVTGDLVTPIKTHPKIKGLAGIGGQPSGDALIGFDKEAYRSYGLKQSLNAAVSEEAASAYRAGLNDLIKNHSQRLVNTRVIHWFKKKVKPQDDLLEWLIEPQEIEELTARQKAKELLESIKTGKRPDLGENYYYVLTLSGAGGRVMVRDWMEGQFEELVKILTGLGRLEGEVSRLLKEYDALRAAYSRAPKFGTKPGQPDLKDIASRLERLTKYSGLLPAGEREKLLKALGPRL